MRQLFSIIFISTIVFAVSAQSAGSLMEAGNNLLANGEYSRAATLFLRADSAFKAVGKDATAEYAQCLHNIGRCYMSAGNNAKGRDYTLQAATLREKLLGRQSEPYITSLNNYALGWYNDKDYGRALALHKEVIGLCESLPKPHKDEGMFRTNLGRDYLALGLQDSAAMAMERALPLVEKFGQNYEFLLYYLGEIYGTRDDLENLDRILTLQDEHNEHELTKECNEPDCMMERAEYYLNKNDLANARDSYIKLLGMEMDDETRALACMKYAGFLSRDLRDQGQASDYYMLASHAAERAGMKSDYVIMFKLQSARCKFLNKEYDKAAATAAAAHQSAETAGNLNLSKEALEIIGNSHKALKNYTKSAEVYSELLKLISADGGNESAYYAKILNSLATAEKFNKDYDRSIEHYRKAIDIYTALNMPAELENTVNGLKTCLIYSGRGTDEPFKSNEFALTGRLQKILNEELAGLPMVKNHLGQHTYARSLATIAGCYAMLEDQDSAVNYYSQYVTELRHALLEAFRMSDAKDRTNIWRDENTNLRQLSELHAAIPDASPLKAQCAATMFDLQLLRKGLLLTSAIEFEKLLHRRNDPGLTAKYNSAKALAEALAMERSKITTAEETADIAQRQTELDRMMLEIYKACAEAGDYTDYMRYGIEDVRNALPENSAAVEFVILDDMILQDQSHAAALVMRKDSPEIATVMLPTVADLRMMAASSDLTANEEYGRAIWHEIVKAGDIQKIFFSPDGALHQIPLEYLRLDGAAMADRYDMVRLTSTKELCRKRQPFEIDAMTLFGDIDYDAEPVEDAAPQTKQNQTPIRPDQKRQSAGPNLAQLPGTRIEVNTIDSLYSVRIQPKLYTGTNATKEAFMESHKQHPDILHISTHGKYEPHKGITEDQSMANSVLAFAGANNYDGLDGNPAVANAAEIAGMNLSGCRLTVLSACESGLGKAGDDGIFGLQRGFKNAGVESLIVTLQSVNDLKAAELMIAFYRHLHEGMSPRRALQTAQAEARKTDPADTTWASFILIDGF